MGNKKLPYFLGENKDLGEAKRMQAENKAKRAEFMKKMRAYHEKPTKLFHKNFMRWVSSNGKLRSGSKKDLKSQRKTSLQNRVGKSWRENFLPSSPNALLNAIHGKARIPKKQRNQIQQIFPPLRRKSSDLEITTPRKHNCRWRQTEWIFLHKTKKQTFL